MVTRSQDAYSNSVQLHCTDSIKCNVKERIYGISEGTLICSQLKAKASSYSSRSHCSRLEHHYHLHSTYLNPNSILCPHQHSDSMMEQAHFILGSPIPREHLPTAQPGAKLFMLCRKSPKLCSKGFLAPGLWYWTLFPDQPKQQSYPPVFKNRITLLLHDPSIICYTITGHSRGSSP